MRSEYRKPCFGLRPALSPGVLRAAWENPETEEDQLDYTVGSRLGLVVEVFIWQRRGLTLVTSPSPNYFPKFYCIEDWCLNIGIWRERRR